MTINQKTVSLIIVALTASGCAALGGKTDIDALDGAGVTVVSYEAESRGAYFSNGAVDARYCAEPPPDVALSRALEAAARFSRGDIGAEASAKLSSNAIELAGRSQLVLLARELLYRACEMSLNGAFNEAEAASQFSAIVAVVGKLGEAATASANADQKRAEADTKAAEAELARQKRLLDLQLNAAER